MSRNRLLRAITFLLVLTLAVILTTRAISPSFASESEAQLQTMRPGYSQLPPALVEQLGVATTQNSQSKFVRIDDDTESISVHVPEAWHDVETGPWLLHGKEVGLFITASTDLDGYYSDNGTAGVFFGVSHDLVGRVRIPNPAQMLNPAIGQLLYAESGDNQRRCHYGGRFVQENNFFRGQYDLYLNCTRGPQGKLVVVTMPAYQEVIALLRITVSNQADLDAATEILNTYQVLDPNLRDEHEH